MTVKMRQAVESRIAKKTIEVLLAAGYTLGVNDGEETTVKNSTDAVALFAAMFTTDEDRLLTKSPKGKNGWIYFVYGNDGTDVINDYTTDLEEVLKPVSALCEKIEEGDIFTPTTGELASRFPWLTDSPEEANALVRAAWELRAIFTMDELRKWYKDAL